MTVKNATRLIKLLIPKSHKLNKIKGFTLIETLSILTISSIVLLMALGAGLTMTKTFVNTLSAKSLLEFIRTTKNLAIMATETPGQYVYAIGVLITPNSKGGFNIARVTYNETGTSFYKQYQDPANMNNIIAQADSDSVDTFTRLYIPAQVKLQVTDHNDSPISCARLAIFFEELYGKPHFYCLHNNTYSEINDTIHILFQDTKYRIVLNQDSQVYGSYKTQ